MVLLIHIVQTSLEAKHVHPINYLMLRPFSMREKKEKSAEISGFCETNTFLSVDVLKLPGT